VLCHVCSCLHRLFLFVSVARVLLSSQYANRRHKDVTSPERAEELVKQGGLACLEALTMLPLPEEVCAWMFTLAVCVVP